VYLIRKRHECQERFCILAKKSARLPGAAQRALLP